MIRAKYQPYDALRQRFWWQFLKQYDSDDTGCLSHLELTSMLDSLGSTLSTETINSFFTRWDKKPAEDNLTYAEAIQCLEAEICRPSSEKKRIEHDYKGLDTSTAVTPSLNASDPHTALALDKLSFYGPEHNLSGPAPNTSKPAQQGVPPSLQPAHPKAHATEPMQRVLLREEKEVKDVIEHPFAHFEAARGRHGAAALAPPMVHQTSASSSDAEDSSASGASASGSGSGSRSGGWSSSDDAFERVINVKNCPLCHRPRLNSKAERDIVTHLAVCASQDWARVDRIMVNNFVTASQAQRKWYTRVLSKVSSGDYKLGAVSIPCFLLRCLLRC